MSVSKNPSISPEDVFFLLEKLSQDNIDLREGQKNIQKTLDRFSTLLVNAIGDIAEIKENMTVSDHHSSQHFEKDEQQDQRLDRVETTLRLPKFAF
ncbi:MAG TPA: hypothetical protein VLH19_05710 [Patescibacteria group bacterium]|nr:hypothetical protein [Patescibacteria group bacterium]